MDAFAIFAKMRRHSSEPFVIDTKAYGAWFEMMSREATQTDEELAGRDIALLNLEAALGLPGAENLNLDGCVQKLNAWAKQVGIYTQDHWHLFERSPEEYDFSRGHFLILALVTFLQRHLGVHYNLSFSEGEYNATDSRSLFIHGILAGHGGTCVTMPVLYIAIGRRLGYPLYLVQAKEHLFARWEELGGDRFNIECTSPGFRPLDDEYYHHRPKPLTAEDLRAGNFLRNLGPREELSQFLCERTRCLIDNLRLGEALRSIFLARQLAVEDPGVRGLWVITTIMARALEKVRDEASLDGYWGLDLTKVCVPDEGDPFERWAAPIVRESLQRIARIHANNHARAREGVFATLAGANDRRFPLTNF